jgi:hypothetical protein
VSEQIPRDELERLNPDASPRHLARLAALEQLLAEDDERMARESGDSVDLEPGD